jgi:hypothetical protein
VAAIDVVRPQAVHHHDNHVHARRRLGASAASREQREPGRARSSSAKELATRNCVCSRAPPARVSVRRHSAATGPW